MMKPSTNIISTAQECLDWARQGTEERKHRWAVIKPDGVIELNETKPSFEDLQAAVADERVGRTVQWVPIVESDGIASAALWVNENGVFTLTQNKFALTALASYVEGGDRGWLFGTVIVSAQLDDE